MTHEITQEITIAATPEQVYSFLTNAGTFAEVSGAPAKIGEGEGAAFALFGGAITGRVVECVSGTRVVQAWRAGPWPAGVFSIVRFELEASGGTTRILLHHSSFPAGQDEHLAAGWHSNYWDKLKAHFGAK